MPKRLIYLIICILMAVTTHTVLAVGTDTSQAVRHHRYSKTHYDDHNGMSQWHITRIIQDKKGFMWFSTWNGLNRFDGYEFAVFKSQPGDGNNITSDRIRNMMLGEDGNIYCLINDHVWRFNLTTYQFEDTDPATSERYSARMDVDKIVHSERQQVVGGMQYTDVRQVFVDFQRNFWVMRVYGVDKVSPLPQPAQVVEAVPDDVIRALFIDKKKRVWVTSRDNGVITVLDSKARLIGYLGNDGRLHPQPVRFDRIYCICQQRNGTIWMGAKPGGLYRLTETADGVFHIENIKRTTDADVKIGKSISYNSIYDIKEDSRGRLWIATHGDGINMIENPNAAAGGNGIIPLKVHSRETDMLNYPATSLTVRRLKLLDDNTLLATTTEGFIVATGINGNLRTAKFNRHIRESNRKSSLSNSATMDMLIDRKGRLFISTESGGVNMLLSKSVLDEKLDFRHFTANEGMGSDATLAMTEVGDELLIQCNNQLTRLNVDLNQIENFNDRFFSFEPRFSDAEPLMLPDGRWAITTENGLLLCGEQTFHQQSYVPRIVLTSLLIPGRSKDYTADACDTIRLTSSERNLTINYAALDYTDNSQIKYITRLLPEQSWQRDSVDIPWSSPSFNRSVSFYDLHPGRYNLQIRSTNAEGLWTDNIRTITIIVKPAFYETTLAYLIYILLLIGAVSSITYTIFYIQQLKRQREETLQAYLRLFEQTTTPQTIIPPHDQATSPDAEGADAQPMSTTVNPATTVPTPQLVVASPHLSEDDDDFMNRLMQFVEENLSNSSIGVEEMASATATSRSSLNRRTKSLLGITPADFLKEARLKRACNLLQTTQKSINDIAYSCGFSDPKYFSKCFKASKGVSPSDYRTAN